MSRDTEPYIAARFPELRGLLINDFTKDLIANFGIESLHWSMLGGQGELIFKDFLKRIKPKRVLEIGTFQGISTLLLAQHSVEVITLDVKGHPLKYKIWEHCHVRDKIDPYVIEDRDLIASFINGLDFDFCFIDGDHSYEGVKFDFDMVKRCGRVLFHDYEATIYKDTVVKFVDEIKEGTVEKRVPFAYWEGQK